MKKNAGTINSTRGWCTCPSILNCITHSVSPTEYCIIPFALLAKRPGFDKVVMGAVSVVAYAWQCRHTETLWRHCERSRLTQTGTQINKVQFQLYQRVDVVPLDRRGTFKADWHMRVCVRVLRAAVRRRIRNARKTHVRKADFGFLKYLGISTVSYAKYLRTS